MMGEEKSNHERNLLNHTTLASLETDMFPEVRPKVVQNRLIDVSHSHKYMPELY